MKRVILTILKKNFGTKRMQSFYEALFRIGLKGMNYGNGGDFKESGELNVLAYVREKLKHKKSLTLFDVGGNVGNYSLALADFFGSNASIHSFEPSKKTFERFIKNTSHIGNIVPHNFGLGDSENTLQLYTNKEGSGLASVYHRNLEYTGIMMDTSEEINITTIDQYCQKNQIKDIQFLKLDIEGHELSALRGATDMLEKGKVDFIQFEFGGTNIDSRTYFKDFYFMLGNRFRIYRILKDGLIEIPQYKISQEIFVSINYLAERISE